MTQLDDRLRGLREMTVAEGGSLDALRRRARRRRARRVSGATVLAAVVAIGSVALWPTGAEESRLDVVDDTTTSTAPSSTTTSTTSTTSTTATTTSTTVATPTPTGAVIFPTGVALGPGELVVSRYLPGEEDPGTSELSVISAIDGSIARTLDSVGAAEGGISDVALSADRRTVLATRGTSACTGELVAYAADGTGEPVVYPQFANPLRIDRSPDGASIAVSSDDDCDGIQTISVWPVGGGEVPLAVFGDGGVAGGGLVTDPGDSPPGGGTLGDPFVASLSYRDPDTLDVVVENVGARTIDLVTGTTTELGLGNASYLGFTSTDALVRLALVRTDTGVEFGVETEFGIEQRVRLDDPPIDVASIGGEQVWVTPDNTLFRVLEVSTLELRSDVAAVA